MQDGCLKGQKYELQKTLSLIDPGTFKIFTGTFPYTHKALY